MSETLDLILRPVGAGDRELLVRSMTAAREIELSIMPWDAEQKRTFVEHQLDLQTSYYEEKFPNSTHDVIVLAGDDAGRLYVDRDATSIEILDIVVLPEYRRRGIGTYFIEGLKRDAAELDGKVGVYIEPFNPSQELFKSLGFTEISRGEISVRYEWRAVPG